MPARPSPKKNYRLSKRSKVVACRLSNAGAAALQAVSDAAGVLPSRFVQTAILDALQAHSDRLHTTPAETLRQLWFAPEASADTPEPPAGSITPDFASRQAAMGAASCSE